MAVRFARRNIKRNKESNNQLETKHTHTEGEREIRLPINIS